MWKRSNHLHVFLQLLRARPRYIPPSAFLLPSPLLSSHTPWSGRREHSASLSPSSVESTGEGRPGHSLDSRPGCYACTSVASLNKISLNSRQASLGQGVASLRTAGKERARRAGEERARRADLQLGCTFFTWQHMHTSPADGPPPSPLHACR